MTAEPWPKPRNFFRISQLMYLVALAACDPTLRPFEIKDDAGDASVALDGQAVDAVVDASSRDTAADAFVVTDTFVGSDAGTTDSRATDGQLDTTGDAARSMPTWTQVSTSGPPPRREHAMVYDPDRHHILMFGGFGANNTFLNDMWTWNGSGWDEVQVATRPSARGGHGMVFDEVRREIVLFGGAAADGLRSDTWSWNGSEWTLRVAHDPSPPCCDFFNHPQPAQTELAWDGTGRKVLMYGRLTYSWDGTRWTRRLVEPPTSSGHATAGHAMVWDPIRRHVVGVGGYDGFNTSPETYAWAGSGWEIIPTQTSAPPRESHDMVFDTQRGIAIVFGGLSPRGADAFLQTDTWTWNGRDWLEWRTPAAPEARSEHKMEYDRDRGTTVLFGGCGESRLVAPNTYATPILGDTWVLR